MSILYAFELVHILHMLIQYVIKRVNITDSHSYKSQHIGQHLEYSELRTDVI